MVLPIGGWKFDSGVPASLGDHGFRCGAPRSRTAPSGFGSGRSDLCDGSLGGECSGSFAGDEEWRGAAPHPDPAQEIFFFGLVREALQAGDISEELLRDEIAKGHLRSDAMKLIDC